ncbi:PIG-L deacetylase family protein [Candidatus Latescibacterota bacterium]
MEGLNTTGVASNIIVDKKLSGKPHKGKVLAVIQSNLSDIPFFAGGTCAKLIDEGYTGYLIRTSNDEKSGTGSIFHNISTSEKENLRLAETLGFSDVFDLAYRQHEMNGISQVELRGRLIYIFRLLKVDTVIKYNPSSEYENNPDRWITGQAVEQACFMAGNEYHYPEHEEAGLMPHPVNDWYYIAAQSGQSYNRVVDIGSTLEKKIDAIVECKSHGVGDSGSMLRKRLAKEGKKLSILGNDDDTANSEYVRHFLLTSFKKNGENYNLPYAEKFMYFATEDHHSKEVDDYIKKYAEKI